MLPARIGLWLLTRLDIAQGNIEPEILYVFGALKQRRLAIDIGSNNGVTTMVLASQFSEVRAFEANPRLAARVAPGLPGNAYLWPLGLSNCSGTAELRIPCCAGVLLDGWASLDKPMVGDESAWQRVEVEIRTLDSFGFEQVDLIKLDVEGHEMAVLEGAKETLVRNRPWLIVEVMEERRPLMIRFLTSLGYHAVALHEICGISGSPQNMVFAPD